MERVGADDGSRRCVGNGAQRANPYGNRARLYLYIAVTSRQRCECVGYVLVGISFFFAFIALPARNIGAERLKPESKRRRSHGGRRMQKKKKYLCRSQEREKLYLCTDHISHTRGKQTLEECRDARTKEPVRYCPRRERERKINGACVLLYRQVTARTVTRSYKMLSYSTRRA